MGTILNPGNTALTAFVRAFISALIVGATAGLTAAQQGLGNRESIITGILSGLAILGSRGLGEGLYDVDRQVAGDVKKSDVQPNP